MFSTRSEAHHRLVEPPPITHVVPNANHSKKLKIEIPYLATRLRPRRVPVSRFLREDAQTRSRGVNLPPEKIYDLDPIRKHNPIPLGMIRGEMTRWPKWRRRGARDQDKERAGANPSSGTDGFVGLQGTAEHEGTREHGNTGVARGEEAVWVR